jgi:uncharacterized damage-inducible protein DinB
MSMPSRSTNLRDLAFGDLEREIMVTRRVLERLPADQLKWKVHEKSMDLGGLAMHVVNLLQWMLDTLLKDEFDMGSPTSMRNEPAGRDDLMQTFDQNATALQKAMSQTDDVALARTWTLRQGDQVLVSQPKAKILRLFCLSHLIHHRAQLCVYLRLLNVPVPAVYFNSSDEPDWVLT